MLAPIGDEFRQCDPGVAVANGYLGLVIDVIQNRLGVFPRRSLAQADTQEVFLLPQGSPDRTRHGGGVSHKVTMLLGGIAAAASWLRDAMDLIGGQISQHLARAAGPAHFELLHGLERTQTEMRARVP